jgi:hypothetical protein
MKRAVVAAITVLVASAANAHEEEHRELGAHEHGVGQLEIAIEGQTVRIELHAPGADIVGFEHAAESAEDRGVIDRAVATLARPLELFILPEAAGCSVTEAEALLAGEEHEHDEHAEEEHEGHSEFHAAYVLTCADPNAIRQIDFAYFGNFPNARELEVQIVTDKGAQAFEVERDAPVVSLEGMI